MADHKPVLLDYSYCLNKTIGENGLDDASLKRLGAEVGAAHQVLEKMRAADILGFWNLPAQSAVELEPIITLAAKWQGQVDNLVVLGIGGSALGTTAVDMALSGGLRLALPGREGRVKVWVADNSDPRSFSAIINNLDPERTLYNVISKSGSTAETMSQFLVVLERLTVKLGKEKAQSRIIFTTDPEEGALRKLANKEGFCSLVVPANVGGRFSVLSAVGLFPLAMAGYDIQALLGGAGEMLARCQAPALTENPAYMFAALGVEAMRKQRNIMVMMPYVSDLLGVAQWFVQLWAESLGKRYNLAGEEVFTGQTPLAAIGATDQHSQLQLYMEGPSDKLICFLTLENYGRDLEIPELYPDEPSFSYLGGGSMSELIQAEAKATAVALALSGRPSMNLKLPALNEHVLGQLLFLLEVATVAAGAMLGIDPLDQPGVELSKKLTYGLMGRDGFDDFRKMLDEQILKKPFTV